MTKLTGALLELMRPQAWKLMLLKALEERAQWLALGEEVMTPELDVLEKPGHIDTLTGVASEDGSGDVVVVSHHLGLVEAKLIMPVPVVEAEQEGRENALDGVKQRGCRVREVAGLGGSVVLADHAKDPEDVGLLGESFDFD